MSATPDKVTPEQLARRWSVSKRTVYAWIHDAELPATNVAIRKGGRPKYRIDERDIAEFDRLRTAKVATRRRKPLRAALPNGMVRLVG